MRPHCGTFSVRVGTVVQGSHLWHRAWVVAIYLVATSLKGVSSMKLQRELSVTQKTSWYLVHRIRETWGSDIEGLFGGPIEADESYIGGKEGTKHSRKKLRAGHGPVGKTEVAGIKDRGTNKVVAKVVPDKGCAGLYGRTECA